MSRSSSRSFCAPRMFSVVVVVVVVICVGVGATFIHHTAENTLNCTLFVFIWQSREGQAADVTASSRPAGTGVIGSSVRQGNLIQYNMTWYDMI